jgi:hypothetical protein
MKKMLLLPFAFAALSGVPLHAQPRPSHWKLEVEVNSRLRFTLRMESDPSRGAPHPAFRLQILAGSPSERSLILFEIGDRPHA